MSPPKPIGEHLELTKAPSPPELPPGVLFLSHGFYVLPHNKLLHYEFIQSWGTLVLTNGIIPAVFKTVTIDPSFSYLSS